MRSRYITHAAIAAGAVAVLLLTVLVTLHLAPGTARGEPVITTTYYAEKSGPEATGRLCSQTLAQTATDVAVAVSCSYPPAESRIAELLQGAGQ